jgi:hypothetical protein
MRITLEMNEEEDFEKSNLSTEVLKIIFAEKIAKILKLRKTDKIKVNIKRIIALLKRDNKSSQIAPKKTGVIFKNKSRGRK